MKTKKQFHKLYKVPIYQSEVLFIYYNDYKYVNKVMKKFGFSDTMDINDEGMQGFEDFTNPDETKGKRKFFMAVRMDKEDLENTLVHETLHLTQDILEYKEIKFRKGSNNEAYTYLQSYLYQEFLKLIQK